MAADGKLMAVDVRAGSTFEVGAPRALFQTIIREGGGGSYSVSKDGQRFLVNAPREAADLSPITVVVNWTAVLKK